MLLCLLGLGHSLRLFRVVACLVVAMMCLVPTASGTPYIDLHNHYIGAPLAEDIVRIATENQVLYPAHLLNEIGIQANPADGFVQLTSLSRKQLSKFRRSLEITDKSTFSELENVYRRRLPILRNEDCLPSLIDAIARHLKRNKVIYTELSISASWFLEPVVFEIFKTASEKANRDHSVRIKYLASVQRSSSTAEQKQRLALVRSKLNEEILTGVDIVGFEDRPISEMNTFIKAAAELKQTRPNFQIRAHVGETRYFTDNVRSAIEAGATRIGHGVHGVDKMTMALAVKENVIFEANPTSNFRLRMIERTSQLPFDQLVAHAVQMTVGSDGSGLFRTSSAAEIEETLRPVVSERARESIFETNKRYLREVGMRCESLFLAL